MAEFEVKIVRVDDVIEHPDADRLTIVKIGGYRCIANKLEDGTWRYQKGDLVIYIPEGSVLQEWMLRDLNMWNEAEGKGFLAGSAGNRVRAIKLRGVVSQGVLMPVRVEEQTLKNGSTWYYLSFQAEDAGRMIAEGADLEVCKAEVLGWDVAEELGIVKYEPPIPESMAGEVIPLHEHCLKFDVENWQKYPHLLEDGEEVVMTEKLHGTFTCFGFISELNHPELMLGGNAFAASKGLMGQGLVFKGNETNLSKNVYVRMLQELFGSGDPNGPAVLSKIFGQGSESVDKLYIMGEIFGAGVQDLHYGQKGKSFRVFDIYVVKDGEAGYLDYDQMVRMTDLLGLETVPLLYRGPFSEDVMVQHRDGKDTISGSNVREGTVIKPVLERRCDEIGRVMLKSVSPKYLLRKGGTELQ